MTERELWRGTDSDGIEANPWPQESVRKRKTMKKYKVHRHAYNDAMRVNNLLAMRCCRCTVLFDSDATEQEAQTSFERECSAPHHDGETRLPLCPDCYTFVIERG